jgi:hypothetical protein
MHFAIVRRPFTEHRSSRFSARLTMSITEFPTRTGPPEQGPAHVRLRNIETTKRNTRRFFNVLKPMFRVQVRAPLVDHLCLNSRSRYAAKDKIRVHGAFEVSSMCKSLI